MFLFAAGTGRNTSISLIALVFDKYTKPLDIPLNKFFFALKQPFLINRVLS